MFDPEISAALKELSATIEARIGLSASMDDLITETIRTAANDGFLNGIGAVRDGFSIIKDRDIPLSWKTVDHFLEALIRVA